MVIKLRSPLARLVVALHAQKQNKVKFHVLAQDWIVFTWKTRKPVSANPGLYPLTALIQILTASLTVRKRFMKGARIIRNKICMEYARTRLIASRSVAALERYRVDLVYASAITLRAWMTFAMISADKMLSRYLSQLMARCRCMIQLPKLQETFLCKYLQSFLTYNL